MSVECAWLCYVETKPCRHGSKCGLQQWIGLSWLHIATSGHSKIFLSQLVGTQSYRSYQCLKLHQPLLSGEVSQHSKCRKHFSPLPLGWGEKSTWETLVCTTDSGGFSGRFFQQNQPQQLGPQLKVWRWTSHSPSLGEAVSASHWHCWWPSHSAGVNGQWISQGLSRCYHISR